MFEYPELSSKLYNSAGSFLLLNLEADNLIYGQINVDKQSGFLQDKEIQFVHEIKSLVSF